MRGGQSVHEVLPPLQLGVLGGVELGGRHRLDDWSSGVCQWGGVFADDAHEEQRDYQSNVKALSKIKNYI